MKQAQKQTQIISRLNQARNVKEVFELVKHVVIDTFAIKKDKLVIAAGNLEADSNLILGGFYSPQDNAIVLNKNILKNIKNQNPRIYNSYLFHVLLHEYLHSIGFRDELETRKLAFLISNKHLGFQHDATQIALNPGAYLRNLITNQTSGFDEMYDDSFFQKGSDDINDEDDDKSIINYIG